MIRRVTLVAQREFLEDVRTKGFWIGIFIFPVLLVLSIAVPRLLERARDARLFAVVDRSGWALDEARAAIAADTASARRFRLEPAPAGDSAEAILTRRVAAGELFAYFVIGPDPVAGNEGAKYVSRNLTDTDLRRWFANHLSAVVQQRRLARERIAPEVALWIQAPASFEQVRVTRTGEVAEADRASRLRQFAPMAFVYLLFVSVFSISQGLLTNTIEEKTSRIAEVLLSAVSPLELMAGKIAGAAFTGLVVVVSWIVSFVVGVRFLPRLLGAPASVDLSPLLEDPLMLASFVMYFLLGYLLFAAVFVAVGASVSSLKEAQNLVGPMMLVMIVPLFTMEPIARDPNGTLARVLSFVPILTPYVMMNRAAGPPTAMEYALTTLLLLLSIWAVLWAAAKVFRIGILLTGKPPRLREILHWIRAPVGVVPERARSD